MSATAERIVDAALELAAEAGWRETTLAAVAERAGTDLAALRERFSCREALARAVFERVDAAMLAGPGFEPEDGPRDRLFDLLMRRFDALAPHRGAIRSIWRDLPRDPLGALMLLPSLGAAMAWALEAAGLGPRGLQGLVRIQILAAVYLAAMRAWLEDESGDGARTMAALDRGLQRWGRCFE